MGFQEWSQPPARPAGSPGVRVTLQSGSCLKARELGLHLNFEICSCADIILHPLILVPSDSVVMLRISFLELIVSDFLVSLFLGGLAKGLYHFSLSS